MAIIIRLGKMQDVPAFVEAGRIVHSTTRFQVFDYNADKVARSLRSIIENPHGGYCFIVADDGGGHPVGWLIGCIEQHLFSDQLVASVINYGVLPGRRMSGAGLKLLAAFRKWAENRGAVELCAGVNSGTEIGKMDRFLKKLGFRLTGGNYAMSLTMSATSQAVGSRRRQG